MINTGPTEPQNNPTELRLKFDEACRALDELQLALLPYESSIRAIGGVSNAHMSATEKMKYAANILKLRGE